MEGGAFDDPIVGEAAEQVNRAVGRLDRNALADRHPIPALRPATTLQQIAGVEPQFGVLRRGSIGLQLVGEIFQRARWAAAFAEALRELAATESIDERRLLLAETLDCCSHRLDAWLTSAASRRLASLRAAGATGTNIGAYGWLENIALATPAAAGQVDGLDVLHDGTDGGFVHAPGLAHAAAAGVLRSGRLTHRRTDPASEPLDLDLSSTRTRDALTLLDGMRRGQSLGALLGYRLERRLHERSGAGLELDRFIYVLRTLAPLRAGKLTDPGTPGRREPRGVRCRRWPPTRRARPERRQGAPDRGPDRRSLHPGGLVGRTDARRAGGRPGRDRRARSDARRRRGRPPRRVGLSTRDGQPDARRRGAGCPWRRRGGPARAGDRPHPAVRCPDPAPAGDRRDRTAAGRRRRLGRGCAASQGRAASRGVGAGCPRRPGDDRPGGRRPAHAGRRRAVRARCAVRRRWRQRGLQHAGPSSTSGDPDPRRGPRSAGTHLGAGGDAARDHRHGASARRRRRRAPGGRGRDRSSAGHGGAGGSGQRRDGSPGCRDQRPGPDRRARADRPARPRRAGRGPAGGRAGRAPGGVGRSGRRTRSRCSTTWLPFGLRPPPSIDAREAAEQTATVLALVEEGRQRVAAARALIEPPPPPPPPEPPPPPKPPPTAEQASAALAAIFGQGFVSLPVLLAPPPGEADLWTGSVGPAGVRARPGAEIRPWLARMGRLRDSVSAYGEALLVREASGGRPALRVIQSPAGAFGSWVGLPFPDARPPETPMTSMVAELAGIAAGDPEPDLTGSDRRSRARRVDRGRRATDHAVRPGGPGRRAAAWSTSSRPASP